MTRQGVSKIGILDKHNKPIYFAFAVLCLFGIGVSAELTRIHVFTHTDPNFHSICAVSENVNCETVALSPFSVFAGLPVSVWGIMGYMIMGMIGAWGGLGPRRQPPWMHGGLLFFATFSFAISIALSIVSMTRIDSICLFCMTSYAISVALFVLAVITVQRSGTIIWRLPSSAIGSFFSNPALAGCLLLTIAAMVSMVEAAVKPYWESPGWKDLPQLNRGIDEQGHHWIGATNPTLTVVEFSDYECPHCRKAHKRIRILAAEYPSEVRLYHKHLPLDRKCYPLLKRDFHRFACHFAKAAECAGEQEKFWEMNDALFSIQNEIKSRDVDVELLAVRLGLDRPSFRECMSAKETEEKMKLQMKDALKKKLSSTPTFFIGSLKFTGQIPKSELARLLREAKKNTSAGP